MPRATDAHTHTHTRGLLGKDEAVMMHALLADATSKKCIHQHNNTSTHTRGLLGKEEAASWRRNAKVEDRGAPWNWLRRGFGAMYKKRHWYYEQEEATVECRAAPWNCQPCLLSSRPHTHARLQQLEDPSTMFFDSCVIHSPTT
eukprot:1142867-Pelagomonas_calceolata.AAC.1